MVKPKVENTLAGYYEKRNFMAKNQDKSANSVLEISNMKEDLAGLGKLESFSLDLINCSGDILTNCKSEIEVAQFICQGARILSTGGKLFVSFRDYFRGLGDDDRFVPVQLSQHRLMTQVLDYYTAYVKISEITYEKTPFGEWAQRVESHIKLRIPEGFILDAFVKSGLEVLLFSNEKGIVSILGAKY